MPPARTRGRSTWLPWPAVLAGKAAMVLFMASDIWLYLLVLVPWPDIPDIPDIPDMPLVPPLPLPLVLVSPPDVAADASAETVSVAFMPSSAWPGMLQMIW